MVAQVSSSIGLEMANVQILLLHFSNVSQTLLLLCFFLTTIIGFSIISELKELELCASTHFEEQWKHFSLVMSN